MCENRRVSIKDIAKELNVSLATVHKALTGKPGVGDERRKQITDAARAMGYVVNGAAQSLARKVINLGIIMPSKWQEYFMSMKAGISAQIDSLREYNKINGFFFYITAETDGDKILSWIYENRIDAVIYCPSDRFINNATADALERSALPIFCAGGELDDFASITDVIIDSELSGKLAADFLQCTSAPDIKAAVFTGSLKVSAHRAKTEAFCNRIKASGGQIIEICETEDDVAKAYTEAEKLLSDHPEINGIYVSTSTSDPICRYIDEQNITGISLIGTDIFDSLKEYMKKGIMQATICQNQEKVGQMAVSCAYEYLDKSKSYRGANWSAEKKIPVRPSLLLRANIE